MSVPPSYEHPGSPPRRPELPEGVWRPEPPPEPERADELPRWPLWAPFAAMLATLFVAILGVGVIALLVELAGGNVSDGEGESPGVTIAGTYLQDLALIGVGGRARPHRRPAGHAGQVRPPASPR